VCVCVCECVCVCVCVCVCARARARFATHPTVRELIVAVLCRHRERLLLVIGLDAANVVWLCAWFRVSLT
jgi:hypothetical protein